MRRSRHLCACLSECMCLQRGRIPQQSVQRETFGLSERASLKARVHLSLSLPGQKWSGVWAGRCLSLECLPALGLPWVGGPRRRGPEPQTPSCPAAAFPRPLLPPKCCGNKKQRPLRRGVGEAAGTRGREARGAGARRSNLYLQAPVASTPSRPPSATGRTKAARCAPRGLSASRPGPAGKRHQPAPGPAGAPSHARCCAPRCASARPPGGAARCTVLSKYPHPT